MRKADYALLAQLIQRKREDATRAENGLSREQDLVATAMGQTARDIAEDFARGASVNKPEFLKACGLE